MKRIKDRWDALPNCSKCGSVMRKKTFKMTGFDVRGWECPKCGEVLYMGDDLNKVLVENKLKRGIPVKVGILGNSFVMRIPKEVSSAFDIRKGKEVIFRIKDKELVVEV